MRTIQFRINSIGGNIEANSKHGEEVIINEFENRSTMLVFNFDKPVLDTDKVYIEFRNSKVVKYYELFKKTNTQYYIEIPREILYRGRLYIGIQHYNHEMTVLSKYMFDGYLYVNQAMDITEELMQNRPDLIAEFRYEIDQLKKEIEILKQKG